MLNPENLSSKRYDWFVTEVFDDVRAVILSDSSATLSNAKYQSFESVAAYVYHKLHGHKLHGHRGTTKDERYWKVISESRFFKANEYMSEDLIYYILSSSYVDTLDAGRSGLRPVQKLIYRVSINLAFEIEIVGAY